MAEVRELASGLKFPEGPVAMSDGSVVRVDLDSGAVEVIYKECDGRGLRGPNDLVFDSDGGFWFTDHGTHGERQHDVGGVYYAKADGSEIREAIWGLQSPNGIGLSPDGGTVYVAETWTGRLWSWKVTGPGAVEPEPGLVEHGGHLVAGLPGLQLFDSLGVDAEGNVCVATIITTGGGVTSISPDGSKTELTECGDPLTTNICWGGEGRKTAFITCSATGRLVSVEWPVAGLELAYNA